VKQRRISRVVSPARVAAAVFVVAVLGAVYLLVLDNRRATSGGAQRTAAATASELTSVIVVEGTLVPIRRTSVSSGSEGNVVEVSVEAGSVVAEGDVLIRTDSVVQDDNLRIAQAVLAAAQSRLATARAREAALPATAPTAERELAEAELAAAEAEVSEAEVRVDIANAALTRTTVTAPSAGSLVTVEVEVGERVEQGSIIGVIADLSAWRVESGPVSETLAIRIDPGDGAAVRFPAVPDVEIAGVVQSVEAAPAGPDGPAGFNVVVATATSAPQLRSGLSATVALTTSAP
jgi:macrolide-specific efflux system membrane fusion protein